MNSQEEIDRLAARMASLEADKRLLSILLAIAIAAAIGFAVLAHVVVKA